MNQLGFAANLVEQFFCDDWNPTPDATPYRSGVPIDSIAPSSDADDSPAQIQHTEAYQSLVGSIGWLAGATRPDIAPVHSFLSSYSSKPATGHMKAALYALHYIHSTHNYGITFTSSITYPSIPMFTSWALWTLKLILMLFLHLRQCVHLSPLTAMPVGDLRLALQFVMVLSSLSSNLGV